MFIVLYRWRLKSGTEDRFRDAWAEVTSKYLREFDSRGSRLHRGSDGIYYAYAQWKSAGDRERAFEEADTKQAFLIMRECIAESMDPVELEIVRDFLVRDEKPEN